MITEDQLEQLAIQWFQDTRWSYVGGTELAPEGATPERSDFRTVVLKARLAAAVQRLNPPESFQLRGFVLRPLSDFFESARIFPATI